MQSQRKGLKTTVSGHKVNSNTWATQPTRSPGNAGKLKSHVERSWSKQCFN